MSTPLDTPRPDNWPTASTLTPPIGQLADGAPVAGRYDDDGAPYFVDAKGADWSLSAEEGCFSISIEGAGELDLTVEQLALLRRLLATDHFERLAAYWIAWENQSPPPIFPQDARE